MRLSALVPILLATLALAAEPLRGIPEDVSLAGRISYDTAAKSQLAPLVKALQTRMEGLAAQMDPAAAKANKELQTRLGLTPEGNHQVDLGVRVSLDTSQGLDEPQFRVFVVFKHEGKKSALDTFAKESNASPIAFTGGTAWELSTVMGAVIGANAGSPANLPLESFAEHALFMPEDGVMILAPIRELPLALACWNRKSPSHQLPAPVETLARNTPLSHTVFSANIVQLAKLLADDSSQATEAGAPVSPPAGGMTQAGLIIGEDAKNVLLRASMNYADADLAKLAADQIRGFVPMGSMLAMPNDQDDADTQQIKAQMGRVINSLKVEQEGSQVRLSLQHSLEDMKVLMAQLEKQLITSLQSPPTATPPPAVPAPAKAEIKSKEATESKKGR